MALLRDRDDLMSALRAAAEGSEVLDWGILCQFGNPTYSIHTCPSELWRHAPHHQVRPKSFTTSMSDAMLLLHFVRAQREPRSDNVEVRVNIQRDVAQVEAVRLVEKKDGVDEKLIIALPEWRPVALNVATMAMELKQKGW